MITRITVYTKSNCQPCRATKRWLSKNGHPFQEVNIETDPVALQALITYGFKESPVVEVEDTVGDVTRWSGFRPDLIDALPDWSA